ncbi:MAG: succinate dehydrogenase, cytochrome b556 subunit [Alphaproteobacteria bacterium]|nr:succinate dehydrogenase, cytochrome b556 subunit [Alphaproteobacteria bacterium]
MSETIKKTQRPLSPHLQVYRLPLTALLSISHRACGVGLSVGTALVAAFLIAAAGGEGSYNMVMGLASSLLGQIILFLWSAALYFHMCNGIRHMFWDTGKFLEKDVAMRTNYIVIMFAFILTASTWACAYLTG